MTKRGGDVPLAQRVADRLAQLVPPHATCLVAVSGGPDSLALLDLLSLTASRHGRALLVGHVDHGISPASAAVAGDVRQAAVARGLPYFDAQLNLAASTSETRARTARRAALRGIAAEVGASHVVLAHHADDQAETVLLRLLRGSGPAGLAGMAPRHGIWVRPLLEIRRAELAAHLAAGGIDAWSDPANQDPRHLRSWLRSAVVPTLQLRLPDVIDRLNRSAEQAASARVAWDQVLSQLPGLEVTRDDRGISVAAPVLRGYRSPLRHAVLAAIGRQVGVLIGTRRLAAVDRLLSGQSGGGSVSVSGGVSAELAFGRLTFYLGDLHVGEPAVLELGGAVRVGGAVLTVLAGDCRGGHRDGWSAELVPATYLVRGWRSGDRIRPLGGTGSRAVSVLLREGRVPPARRPGWPVVVSGDDATIVWVPGICRSDAAVPPDGTEAWRVECTVS